MHQELHFIVNVHSPYHQKLFFVETILPRNCFRGNSAHSELSKDNLLYEFAKHNIFFISSK